MLRIARIMAAFVIVAIGAVAVRAVLDFGGVAGEVFELALLIAAMLLVSLSDRELFWAVPPKSSHSKHRTRAIT